MHLRPLLGLVLSLEQVPHGAETIDPVLSALTERRIAYPPASPQIALIRAANGIS